MTFCVCCGEEICNGITVQFKDILGVRCFYHFDYECEKDGVTHCPECGYPQYCGCNNHCRSNIPERIKPYFWEDNGEIVVCPNCGFSAHADFWLTLEGDIVHPIAAKNGVRE
jgi:hypothetical protein